MINSGRNIVLILVGVAMVAFGCGDKQTPTQSSPPSQSSQPAHTPTSAPAATSSPLSWAEVLEQNPDPKVVTDADFLKRITETKLPWRVTDKGTGIEMLLVPPGKFVMGMSPGDTEVPKHIPHEIDVLDSNANARNRGKVTPSKPVFKKVVMDQRDAEIPAHEVTITKAFYLGRTEVTVEQYSRVRQIEGLGGGCTEEGIEWRRASSIAWNIEHGLTKREAQEKADADEPIKVVPVNQPAQRVGWIECQEFCAKTGMKLPTEAQWEYACRAGVREPRYGDLDHIAWSGNNSASTAHTVGVKAPNALGFYDMIGNVSEWCQDYLYGSYYKMCEDGVVDPINLQFGVPGTRVIRGGRFTDSAEYCRASKRDTTDLYWPACGIGFRVVRTAD